MGLNRLLSLSKTSVLPEIKTVNSKGSKIAVKTNTDRENRKEKCKIKETSADISTQKIDKTLKNGKIATTTKKSMLWNTLRMTNKNKSVVKKGKKWKLIGFKAFRLRNSENELCRLSGVCACLKHGLNR